MLFVILSKLKILRLVLLWVKFLFYYNNNIFLFIIIRWTWTAIPWPSSRPFWTSTPGCAQSSVTTSTPCPRTRSSLRGSWRRWTRPKGSGPISGLFSPGVWSLFLSQISSWWVSLMLRAPLIHYTIYIDFLLLYNLWIYLCWVRSECVTLTHLLKYLTLCTHHHINSEKPQTFQHCIMRTKVLSNRDYEVNILP